MKLMNPGVVRGVFLATGLILATTAFGQTEPVTTFNGNSTTVTYNDEAGNRISSTMTGSLTSIETNNLYYGITVSSPQGTVLFNQQSSVVGGAINNVVTAGNETLTLTGNVSYTSNQATVQFTTTSSGTGLNETTSITIGSNNVVTTSSRNNNNGNRTTVTGTMNAAGEFVGQVTVVEVDQAAGKTTTTTVTADGNGNYSNQHVTQTNNNPSSKGGNGAKGGGSKGNPRDQKGKLQY